MSVRAALMAVAMLSAACARAWTDAELRAAHLVGACDRVVDAAVVHGYRPDQAAQAATAARTVALSLARPIPDTTAIAEALAVVEAALAGLSGSVDLRERVHAAQAAVLALRVELVRRWHRLPVRLLPRA